MKKTIPIAADHAGYELKEQLKNVIIALGYNVKDYGTHSLESMDYPDVVHPLCQDLIRGEFELGIIICGSGNGVNITANKYQQIRSALCWNAEIAKLARQHNNANIIALPARYISIEEATKAVLSFLETEFEGGRHQNRVNKITTNK